MSQTPTFPEALRAMINAHLVNVHIALPAKVVKYIASNAAVDAQPTLRMPYKDEGGDRQTEELPVIPNVPVIFPGSGPNRITFPIEIGDTVMLLFSEASLDKWMSEGGVVDPLDDRRNHLSDAVAIPGLYHAKSVSAAGEDALAIEAPEIRLGSHSASDPVALKSDLQELYDIINGWAPVPNDGGSALKVAITAGGGAGWDFPGSTKVKAE